MFKRNYSNFDKFKAELTPDRFFMFLSAAGPCTMCEMCPAREICEVRNEEDCLTTFENWAFAKSE